MPKSTLRYTTKHGSQGWGIWDNQKDKWHSHDFFRDESFATRKMVNLGLDSRRIDDSGSNGSQF